MPPTLRCVMIASARNHCPTPPALSRLDGNCSPERRWLINALGNLYQRSRLYQQLEPLIVSRQGDERIDRSYPAFAPLYLPDGAPPELEQGWQTMLATIRRLRQEANDSGSEFAVAIISPEIVVRLGALSQAEREQFLRDNPTLTNAKLDRPNRRLAEFFRGEEIAFVDLTPAMVEQLAVQRIPLYLLGEGHWSAEGNRVAADILTEWLTQSGLLSPTTEPE